MINHQNGLDESVATLWELVWPTIPTRSSTHLGWLGGPLHCSGRDVGHLLESLQSLPQSTVNTATVQPGVGIWSLPQYLHEMEFPLFELSVPEENWSQCNYFIEVAVITTKYHAPWVGISHSRLSLKSLSLNQWQRPLHDEHLLWEVALFEPEASWSNTTKSRPIG